jgi:pimeloyl-ACP methyl ester carboxylesterase
MPTSLRIIQGANRTLGGIAPRVVARLNQRLFSTPRRFSPRDWELEFEALGTRERLPNGASVLTVGAGRATQFAQFAPALLSAGFRVIGVDGPAHGHSRGSRSDPYLFAETLHEVGEQYGPLYGLVGHSMGGGSIGIALAAGLQADRAVLIASPASLHDVLHRFASAMHMPASATRHFVDALRTQVTARGHSAVDVLELVATLPTRALVIHARDDHEVPFADGERIASAWQQATLLAVDGVGHRRIMRSPDVINATVRFLTD